jgi:tRNA A37 threonylcarbamoyladenosine biosynthesis protein TsaE
MILLKCFNISEANQLQIVSNAIISLILEDIKIHFEHREFSRVENKKNINIFLKGNLGVGKTAFMKNFLKSMGYQGVVKSPSYAILNSYDVKDFSETNFDHHADNNGSNDHNTADFQKLKKQIEQINHFDAYRIQSLQQWLDYQFDDCFSDKQLNFIEWPENCQAALPAPDFEIHFDFINQVNNQQHNQQNAIDLSQNRMIKIYKSSK